MRGKLDENMPIESVAILQSAGWQCDTVYDEVLSGAEDSRVSEVCRAEGRVLFTLDLDFADIRAYPPAEYEGIVVLRPVKTESRQHSAVTRTSDGGVEYRMGCTSALDSRACSGSLSRRRGVGCLTRR